MQTKEQQAEDLHQEALVLSEEGKIDAALKKYREALVLDFSRPTTHYNIGLIHKYRSEWEESFRYNKRAVELDPNDEASNWNLAIAATALGNWQAARSVWNRLGFSIEVGDDPINGDCGVTPVRLNAEEDGEVVWARRIDPVRTRILSIPFPSSGYRYGDVVLNDGAAVGYRMYNGKECPVFNVLALLAPSAWYTFEAELHAPAPEDIRALETLCEKQGVEVDDWTISVRHICKQCSEGTPHAEHDQGKAEHWHERHHVGFASTEDTAVQRVLEAWETDSRRVEWLELALSGAKEP
jgi:tetratricopeptide (TPR) repeat protein